MGKNVYQQILKCKAPCSPVLKAKGMGRKQKPLLDNILKTELNFCRYDFFKDLLCLTAYSSVFL